MGLRLLLKNSQTRIDKKKKHRKHKFLYNLLDEMWDTQNQTSLTSKNVVEFTENVLEHAENFRSTRLFPVKKSRQKVYPSKLLDKLDEKVKTKKVETYLKGIKRRLAFFKEKKTKQNKVIKKFVVKLNKLGAGGNYIETEKGFVRVNLANLSKIKSTLEDEKKRQTALKLMNKKKKNYLESFFYSFFFKTRKKKQIKYYTVPKLVHYILKKEKKLVFKHFVGRKEKKEKNNFLERKGKNKFIGEKGMFIKKGKNEFIGRKGKNKFMGRKTKNKFLGVKGMFIKKTKTGIHVDGFFHRNDSLLGFRFKENYNKNILNEKIAHISKNSVRKIKIR